ncbi:MAG TPA: hypothetical protein VFQ88_03315 [Nevskiaceae bacterium]|nr:hypothetical protein [Nevskiaceae bacterium]
MHRFAGSKNVLAIDTKLAPTASAPQTAFDLLRWRCGIMTIAVLLYGIGWGANKLGFVLWLPAELDRLGLDTAVSGAILARSAPIAAPAGALVVWLH